MAFRLKELRLGYGITRASLSREVRISQGALANYENELRQADYDTLICLAQFFDVSVDYLLGVGLKSPQAKPVNAKEKAAISAFRELSDESRDLAYNLLTHLIELEKGKKNMKNMRVFCPAKINLSLNVGKKRDDGYHFIDSVMQSVDLGDYLSVALRQDRKVNINFLNAEINQKSNSVLKAVDLIKKQFGDFGADIAVEKHIPLSGGLGGSSADAAGIIFALDRLLSLTEKGIDVMDIARKTGSDVPFMINGGCALVSGAGEKIRLAANNLSLNIVVLRKSNVDRVCTSGAIYNIFDGQNTDGILCDNNALVEFLANSDKRAYGLFGNALADAAKQQCPAIKEQLSAFDDDALSVNVSGSGDCVYACFDSFEKACRASEDLKEKGYEAYACRSVKHGIKIV